MNCACVLNPAARAVLDSNNQPVLEFMCDWPGQGTETDAKAMRYYANNQLCTYFGSGDLVVNNGASFPAAGVPGGLTPGQNIPNCKITVVCKDGTTYDSVAFTAIVANPIPSISSAPPPATSKPPKKK